jgi:TonB family protein
MRPIFFAVLLIATSLMATAAPQATGGPLLKADLVGLVSKGAPSTFVADVVQRYGITFEPSEQVLDEFRKVGADDAVITAMRTSWHPDCPVPLSDRDILVLVEHLPSRKIVSMVQRCGIGFQPMGEYFQWLRSSGAKDELIDALRIAAEKPFSRQNLFQLLASGEDCGQIGKGVQERGIDFNPTDEDLGKLRGTGASESLLQAIRDANHAMQPLKQLPNDLEDMWPSQTGTSAARGPRGVRAVCPPSVPSISVFASPDDAHAIVAHLECGDLVAILEKDSGRIGIDKVLVAGRTQGFVQDIYFNSSMALSVTAPVPTFQPEPGYTPKARHHKIQGTVVLWIVVDRQGNVTDARETSKPLGDGLDEKAIEAVKKWKFRPATRNGVPIAARVTVETTFRLFH